jgi:predicted nucleotide-binding protein
MERKAAQSRPEPALYLSIPRKEASRRIAARIERGIELKAHSVHDEKTFEERQKAYWTWNEYNEEMLRRIFTSAEIADEYALWAGIACDEQHRGEVRELYESIDDKIRRLSYINERLGLIPLAPGVGPAQPAPKGETTGMAGGEVFVVHGRDEVVCEAVARFISRLGLTPVIFHEEASQGRTLVEKLEHHGNVGYAVVLLTPDDVGGSCSKELQFRAQQDVVLELGYFIGRLGRDHVCAVHRGELELPSDYMGAIYIPFDGSGDWRLTLAKELKAAGFSVDMNKAL